MAEDNSDPKNTPPKKDLTSLIELSALELAKNPQAPVAEDPSSPTLNEMPPIPQVSDADFANLEDSLVDVAQAPPAEAAPPTPDVPAEPAPMEISASDAPAPVTTWVTPESTSPAVETPLDFSQTAPAQSTAEPQAHLQQPTEEHASSPAPVATEGTQTKVHQDTHTTQNLAPIDPNRPPVVAAPATGTHMHPPTTGAPPDMDAIKKFGNKISIGHPKLEASPAFSILVKSATGSFDEKTQKAIELAIGSEDFGVRIEDLRLQMESGKLFVPQISEFAAILLAQKLHDVIDNIELDLASEIHKSPTLEETTGVSDQFLLDTEHYEYVKEEVHDIAAEPKSENDVFSSNLPELAEFQVTRILGIANASEIMPADIAEDPASKEFEEATERLTKELISRAFKLGAHGILGISFNLRHIDGFKDTAGRVRRAYRIMGSGTAVRARRRNPQGSVQSAVQPSSDVSNIGPFKPEN